MIDGVKGHRDPEIVRKFLGKVVGVLYALSSFHKKIEDRDAKIPGYFHLSKDASNSHAKGRAVRTERKRAGAEEWVQGW